MAFRLLLMPALALMLAQTPQQAPPITTLGQYIGSFHWDAAKSGPMIVIEPDARWIEGVPTDLSSFEQKLVKIGGLSVIAQNWTIAFDEDRLPNAYDSLNIDEKILFLLATLPSSEVEKLSSTGLSASELNGDQRAMLLSLIPDPLSYTQGASTGRGYRSSNPESTVTDDQRSEVRLQLLKGIDVGYAATTKGYSIVSSLRYRGPAGTTVAQSTEGRRTGGLPEIKGQVVESAEKKSDLNWNDSRLSKRLALESASVGKLVDEVQDQTGIEVYADARVSSLKINAYGDTVTARDLLRGITAALGGVVRKVGPAYVIAANLEGEGSRETRLVARAKILKAQIQDKVATWRTVAGQRRLYETIQFRQDDSLQAANIPARDVAPIGGDWNANWAPLAELPAQIQSAITENKRSFAGQGELKPDLEGRVRVSPVLGYRFLLPDGRPLECHPFDPLGGPHITTNSNVEKAESFPVDTALLAKGSAVAIHAEDAGTVLNLCAKLKAAGISEVWLDSESPAAIEAAISTGLTIDLVIHPWAVLRGESCFEPDRNVMGSTGSQLKEILESYNQPAEAAYRNSFSPSDPELGPHWARLAKLIPGKGLHAVIVQNVQPDGYEDASNAGHYSGSQFTVVNGVVVLPTIEESVPSLFKFGYTTNLRLEFLRKYHIDPVDMIDTGVARMAPADSYFDGAQIDPIAPSPYPGIHPISMGRSVDYSVVQSWNTMRNSVFLTSLNDLLGRLSQKSNLLYVQNAPVNGMRNPDESVSLYNPQLTYPTLDWKASTVRIVPLSPSKAEDDQGNLIGKPSIYPKAPTCFDLREVTPGRFSAYLQYMFKPSVPAKH